MLFVSRVWRVGRSVCFPLPKILREMLHLHTDALVMCRVHPPYLTFRVLQEDGAIPVEKFTYHDLPPATLRDDEQDTEVKS